MLHARLSGAVVMVTDHGSCAVAPTALLPCPRALLRTRPGSGEATTFHRHADCRTPSCRRHGFPRALYGPANGGHYATRWISRRSDGVSLGGSIGCQHSVSRPVSSHIHVPRSRGGAAGLPLVVFGAAGATAGGCPGRCAREWRCLSHSAGATHSEAKTVASAAPVMMAAEPPKNTSSTSSSPPTIAVSNPHSPAIANRCPTRTSSA